MTLKPFMLITLYGRRKSHMYKIKTFKTIEARDLWLKKHDGLIQFDEVFINNAYGIEYRYLRRVY
jgi:hypothetical protein